MSTTTAPERTWLWLDEDLAAFLRVEVEDLPEILKASGVPRPLVLGNQHRWVPDDWFVFVGMAAPDRSPDAGELLWERADLCRFLGVSRNTLAKLLNELDDIPEPILQCDGITRWLASDWHQWAAERSTRAGDRGHSTTQPLRGRKTRV